MKKPRNKNISKIDKYFTDRMKYLKDMINSEGESIQYYKENMLASWFKALKAKKGHSEDEEWYSRQVRRMIGILNGNKAHRKELIKKYTELKYIHKTMHRALEERWMDGFADGVKFIQDCNNIDL